MKKTFFLLMSLFTFNSFSLPSPLINFYAHKNLRCIQKHLHSQKGESYGLHSSAHFLYELRELKLKKAKRKEYKELYKRCLASYNEATKNKKKIARNEHLSLLSQKKNIYPKTVIETLETMISPHMKCRGLGADAKALFGAGIGAGLEAQYCWAENGARWIEVGAKASVELGYGAYAGIGYLKENSRLFSDSILSFGNYHNHFMASILGLTREGKEAHSCSSQVPCYEIDKVDYTGIGLGAGLSIHGVGAKFELTVLPLPSNTLLLRRKLFSKS